MSQIRQRHGGSTTSTQLEVPKYTGNEFVRPEPSLYLGGTHHWKNDGLQDIMRCSISPKTSSKTLSMSNKAKMCKDGLEAEPHSLDRIRDLGYVYASEMQCDKAANVLMRGFKRASELSDPSERFKFLLKTAEVSFRSQRFRQAQAILMDIGEEPEDYYEKKAFQLLSCHVNAELGDGSKALSMFSKAVDGEDFDQALKIWAASCLRLKKVGAHPAAKQVVMSKARQGQDHLLDQDRIQTLEHLVNASDQMGESKGIKGMFNSLLDDAKPIPQSVLCMAIACVFMLVVLYHLHIWEKSSLRRMKLL